MMFWVGCTALSSEHPEKLTGAQYRSTQTAYISTVVAALGLRSVALKPTRDD